MCSDIGKHFLEYTWLSNSQDTPYSKHEVYPAPEKMPLQETKLIKLPEPELLPDKMVDFLEMIELRSTQRSYNDSRLSLQELSFLLWCTQGIKMSLPGGRTMRTVPSAGARHPLDTYLCLNNVKGIPAGVYRFLPLEHLLQPLAIDVNDMIAGFQGRQMAAGCAAIFVWAACLSRSYYKFGNRAYRYVFIEAGHVCQNLYLAAEAIQCGVCAIGAYDDECLNKVLKMDGQQDFVVYAATVGKIE